MQQTLPTLSNDHGDYQFRKRLYCMLHGGSVCPRCRTPGRSGFTLSSRRLRASARACSNGSTLSGMRLAAPPRVARSPAPRWSGSVRVSIHGDGRILAARGALGRGAVHLEARGTPVPAPSRARVAPRRRVGASPADAAARARGWGARGWDATSQRERCSSSARRRTEGELHVPPRSRRRLSRPGHGRGDGRAPGRRPRLAGPGARGPRTAARLPPRSRLRLRPVAAATAARACKSNPALGAAGSVAGGWYG